VLGGPFGYYRTVILFSGKGRDRCTKQSTRNFWWGFVPLVLLVLMLCILKPEAERYFRYAEQIRDILIDLPLLANVGGLLCAFWLVARIIGGITLLSSKLWNAKL
jgi:hypothetical protein